MRSGIGRLCRREVILRGVTPKSVTDDGRSERTSAGLPRFESARANPSIDAARKLSDFLAAKSGGRIDLTRTKVSDTDLQ